MNLFRQRWYQRWIDRWIGHLLHLANSGAGQMPYHRDRFYAMKSRILSRLGLCVGTDIQHIVHRCWGTGYRR